MKLVISLRGPRTLSHSFIKLKRAQRDRFTSEFIFKSAEVNQTLECFGNIDEKRVYSE